MSAWIEMIDDSNADPELMEVLNQARTPHGTVDNVMRVHSLRPHTMQGHITLYRAALHNDNNTIPMWLQETVASLVSVLNNCDYSYANHWANAKHLIGDDTKAQSVENIIRSGELRNHQTALTDAELSLLEYARKLTVEPGNMVASDVSCLRDAGWDDGEILEANQIIGYFNYANRLLNGLGVTTAGDIVGYYKDEEDSNGSSTGNKSS